MTNANTITNLPEPKRTVSNFLPGLYTETHSWTDTTAPGGWEVTDQNGERVGYIVKDCYTRRAPTPECPRRILGPVSRYVVWVWSWEVLVPNELKSFKTLAEAKAFARDYSPVPSELL